MNSIQQPEEEFLGIVLGVTLELKGALRHHILQHTGQTSYVLSGLLLNQKLFLQCIEYHFFYRHHWLLIKYSARLTRMMMISTFLKVGRGAGDGETQAWRGFLKPGHRLKIDSLTSLTISYWRWQQCVLYRATQAGSYKVTSTGYQMSHKVKDMRGLCTVCLPSSSHGTFFLISKALPSQHFVQIKS